MFFSTGPLSHYNGTISKRDTSRRVPVSIYFSSDSHVTVHFVHISFECYCLLSSFTDNNGLIWKLNYWSWSMVIVGKYLINIRSTTFSVPCDYSPKINGVERTLPTLSSPERSASVTAADTGVCQLLSLRLTFHCCNSYYLAYYIVKLLVFVTAVIIQHSC